MKHTHGMITNKFLRNCYAREFREMVYVWRPAFRKKEPKYFNGMLWGLESGIWVVQKNLNRLNPLFRLKVLIHRLKRRKSRGKENYEV